MIHIPLTGFDRLNYAAWCAFEHFARTIFRLIVSSVLTETAGYTAGVAGGAASRTEITSPRCKRLWVPSADGLGVQARRRRACYARCVFARDPFKTRNTTDP